MTTPPVLRLGPALLLHGPALDAVRYCVDTTRRLRRHKGLPESGDLAILAAALAEPGQPDIPEPDAAHNDTSEMITTDHAARLLHCSPRTVRRLAPKLGGTRIGGRWMIDPLAITEHLKGAKTP